MNFGDRLSTIWRNKRSFHPVPEVSAGRRTELQVAAILNDRLQDSNYEYAAGLRVPHRKRRREIDLVVTTSNEIWVVELKNWSGFVRLDGQSVIQHRSHGRGVIDHGRLLSDMRHKQRVLKSYLRRSLDEVPKLWSVLVFCNDNLGIDDELMAVDDMDVVGLREFLGVLPSAPPQYGPVWSAIRSIWGGEKSSDSPKKLPAVTEPIRNTREVLAELGTWDLLVLYGGQVISGDVVEISRPELYDRDRFQRLNFDVPRSLGNLFRRQLRVKVTTIARSGEERELALGFDETVRFHAAGQPRPAEYSLRDIEVISFGYISRARQ